VGIGFAIPVNQAKSVVTQLAATGKVTRGWLGVMIQPLTPELAKGFNVAGGGGALVASVQDNSPAARAGVKAGDVITEYDGHKLAQPGDLSKLVAATAVGRQVPLTIVREGKTMTLEAHVARMEEPDQAAVARNDEGKEPLGLSVETITPSVSRELGLADARGVVVRGVRDSSPAEKAGIRPGDVITELDHQPVANAADLKRLLAKHAKGAPVVVLLHRDGNSLYAAMTS
jgi:serine protease Do